MLSAHRFGMRYWLLALAAAVLASRGAGAQTAPAPTSTGSNEMQLQEVVVSGIRESVESAQEIKRIADSVVEAVTPTDLGQFTDAALTESLQRVPGVQIYQNANPNFGGGSSISIRGLGGDFVTTTLNGRSVLGIPAFEGSGAGRDFDFDSLSPDVISGILVYKTPTASLVESGLAGEVNIQTLRPLDYKVPNNGDYFGSIAASGIYQDQRKKYGPRYSAILGAKLLDGTLGVYVAGLTSDEYLQLKDVHVYPLLGSGIGIEGANGATTVYNNILYPSEADSLDNNIHYERRDLSVGVQWRPNDHWEVSLDDVYYKFSTLQDQVEFQNYSGYAIPGLTFAPGGAVVTDGELVSYDTTKAVGGYPIAQYGGGSGGLVGGYTDNINENNMLGANIKFNGGSYQLTADYAHNTNHYTANGASPYIPSIGTPSTAILGAYDFAGGNYAATYYGANTPSNLSLWNFAAGPSNGLSYFNYQTNWAASRDQARLDANWNVSSMWSFKGGVRYEDTKYQTATGTGVQGVNPNNGVNSFTLFATPGDPTTGYYSAVGFITGARVNLPGAPNLPVTSQAGFAASNPWVVSMSDFGRGSSFTGCPTSASTTDPVNLLPINGGNGANVFCNRERTTAIYVQADPNGELWGMNWSGNLGVRALHVHENATGLQLVQTALSNPGGTIINAASSVGNGSNSYWETLPSLNLLLQPTHYINLRFGYAKTVTLPPLSALAPTGTATYYEPVGVVHYANTFSGGDLFLKPTKADNFDVTAEYYTSYGGAIIASLFRKNVKDFNTVLQQLQVPVPGLTGLFNSTTSVNAISGHTSGFEIGTNQPFTFLPSPLDGFGLTANYTYVSSEQTVDTVNGPISTPLPGTAKNNVNATFYYEKHGFSARLAYNYRGDSVYGTGSNSYAGQLIDQEYIKAYKTLDASISQTLVNEHLQIVLTATNLTGANQIVYSGPAQMLTFLNQLPRTYTIALRGKF